MASLALIITALAFILAGLIGAYFGYKTFKLYLAFIAFVAGFFLGMNILGDSHPLAFALAIILGIVFAVLSFFVYKLALMFAFAYIGAMLGSWLLRAVFGIQDQFLLNAVGALIGIGIGIILTIWNIDKPVVAIITALIGAYYIVTGIALVTDNSLRHAITTLPQSLNDLQQINYVASRTVNLLTSDLIYALIFIFFVVSGSIFQLRKWLRR
jgi:hypothetical protein